MTYDPEQQEQLANLKTWWGQYGTMIMIALLLAATTIIAWNGWGAYQRYTSAQASMAYDELRQAAAENNIVKLKQAAGVLFDKFARSAYAQMGGLIAAKANFDAGDFKTTQAQLQWVIEHGQSDEYRLIARLRLAGLLLDEGALDKALAQLDGKIPPGYQAAFADRRGDILVVKKQIEAARAAYQAALEHLEANNPYRQIVQLKLDGLGGNPIPPVAAENR